MSSFDEESNRNEFQRRLIRWLLIGVSLIAVAVALVLVIQSGVQPDSTNVATPSDAELTQTMTVLSDEAEAFFIVGTALDTALGGGFAFPSPDVSGMT